MIKTFAALTAATLLAGGSAMAAEVGIRQSSGSSVRNITGGRVETSYVENGSFREDYNGFEANVAANDFRIGGIGGLETSVDTDGLAGDSDVEVGAAGELRLDGTLAIDGRTSEGFRAGTYGIRETESYNFTGNDLSNFSESSAFSR